MELQTLVSVATMALALSTVAAFAASPATDACAAGGADLPTQWNPQELMREPEYNVGTGSACIADGSSPNYLRDQATLRNEPGASIGAGGVRVADGSAASYQRGQLRRVPCYGVGGGAAK